MRISDCSSDVCSFDLWQRPSASANSCSLSQRRCSTRIRCAQAKAPPKLHRATCRKPVNRAKRLAGGVVGTAGAGKTAGEIGRASWRERVCQYGKISEVAVSLKKQKHRSILLLTD